MKTFLDIYSDYGSIVSKSSELSTGNMHAKNVLSQVPRVWKTTSDTVHTIIGTLAFSDSNSFIVPIDSYYIAMEYVPEGSTFTLEILTDLFSPPTHTYTFVNDYNSGPIFGLGGVFSVGFFWKLTIHTIVPSYINISRIMIGQAWVPNLTVCGDITLNKQGFLKPERKRNGGVYLPPSTNYITSTLTYKELDKTSLFSLQDALCRYGTGTTVFVEGLVNTSAEKSTSMYGRLIKWTEPQKSVSGNYSISITIEESL